MHEINIPNSRIIYQLFVYTGMFLFSLFQFYNNINLIIYILKENRTIGGGYKMFSKQFVIKKNLRAHEYKMPLRFISICQKYLKK